MSEPDRRKTRRRALWFFLGVVGLIVASMAGIFVETWLGAAHVIERERRLVAERIAALRTERASKPNYFEPAEEGNSWDPIVEALEALFQVRLGSPGCFPPYPSDADSKPSPEVVKAAFAKVDGPLQLLKRALRRRWAEPSYRYEEHFNMPLTTDSTAWGAAFIMGEVAVHRHEEGRVEEAADLLIAGWGMADHVAAKGWSNIERARIACVWIFADRLKTMLSNHQLPTRTLERLEKALATPELHRPDVMDFLRRDDVLWRMGILAWIDGTFKGEEFGPGPKPKARHFFSYRVLGAEWLTKKARFMEGIEAAVRLPFRDCERRMEELEGTILSQNSVINNAGGFDARFIIKQAAEDRVTTSLARLAIALARYREEVGEWPGDLAGLAPKYLASIPTDGMNACPFRYWVKDQSATVYALGPDGDDDGGATGRVYPDGDVSWTVKRRSAEVK